MTINQLSVFVENQTGKLVEALEELANADIDMRALSLADTSDFGILRIIVDKPDNAMEVLDNAGFLVKTNSVIAVTIEDRPGGLASVIRILAQAGVGIEYTYAFVAHSRDKAYVILRVDNNDTAIKVLTKSNVSLLTDDDMYNM